MLVSQFRGIKFMYNIDPQERFRLRGTIVGTFLFTIMILDFKRPFQQGYDGTIMKEESEEWKLKGKAANTSK